MMVKVKRGCVRTGPFSSSRALRVDLRKRFDQLMAERSLAGMVRESGVTEFTLLKLQYGGYAAVESVERVERWMEGA